MIESGGTSANPSFQDRLSSPISNCSLLSRLQLYVNSTVCRCFLMKLPESTEAWLALQQSKTAGM